MFDLPPPDPAIEVSIASRGMSKGIAQTDGPQLVVKPTAKLGDLQIGAQWKYVTSAAATGEGAIFVGLSRTVAKFQLGLQAAHKFQTEVREPTDDHSWEFTGSVTRKFGRASLRVQTIYSPDDLGSARRSIYVEGGSTFDLDKPTKLTVALGRRDRVSGDDYTSFNAGLSRAIFKGFTVEARWYASNRGELGENYRNRVVAMARWAL